MKSSESAKAKTGKAFCPALSEFAAISDQDLSAAPV
jgi:hypothetical protein